MKQVITIAPGGGMQTLQRKRGKGLDLRQFGNASMERASLIKLHENHQKFYVDIQPHGSEKYAGPLEQQAFEIITGVEREDAERTLGLAETLWVDIETDVMLFDDYDDAVLAEVKFLDALRLKGREIAPA